LFIFLTYFQFFGYPMPKNKPHCLIALAFFVLQNSCSRSPLGPSTASIGGVSTLAAAQVTLYSGTQLAPASPSVRLAMISPDGSRSEAWTAQGSNAGQPIAFFSGLSQAGTYRFGVADQASRTPQWTSFVLAPGASSLTVPLQMSGSALTLTDQLAGQANDYKYLPGTWHYLVGWSNPTALQSDLALDVDPASLPAGWAYSFSPAVLLAGQSSVLTVSYPEACLTPTAQLQVRGKAGSNIIGLASKSLNRSWTMSLSATFSNYTPLNSAPNSTNAAWNGPLSIGVQVSGAQLPPGAFALVSLPYEAAPSTTLRANGNLLCGYMDSVTQRDSGGAPVLLNAGADTMLNSPIRSWFNSGWQMHDIFSCVNADYGDHETFIFNVHLDNTDLVFQQTFLWPFN
jgi:hypothetical protein